MMQLIHCRVQEQVEEMKKKEERMEKQMADIMAENRRLTEPLQKAREDVDELRRQLANYDKDKQSLAVRGNFSFGLNCSAFF